MCFKYAIANAKNHKFYFNIYVVLRHKVIAAWPLPGSYRYVQVR